MERIGVSLPASDQLALNAASTQAQASQEVLARYGPEVAAKIVPLASDAFTDGLRLAYCLALAFAVLGLIFSLRLDESKLRGVDQEPEPG